MDLTVSINRAPDGSFRGRCLALPGCVVWGRSREETRRNLHEAVRGYLASLDVALPREISRIAARQTF
jgi:predicted RNase H-like HicB family nuclease